MRHKNHRVKHHTNKPATLLHTVMTVQSNQRAVLLLTRCKIAQDVFPHHACTAANKKIKSDRKILLKPCFTFTDPSNWRHVLRMSQKSTRLL